VKAAAPDPSAAVTAIPPPRRLPWHSGDWSRLATLLAAGRLPHALLLIGDPAHGVLDFAGRAVARLLCIAPVAGDGAAEACGHCTGCRLLAAGSHPDLHRLEPEEGHEQIRVDEARAAVAFAGLTAGQGALKLILVPGAERLNVQAANCLLKTLEEPPAGTLFLLTTRRPARLLVTVRSRCQRFALRPPARAAALAWLGEQGLPAAEAESRLDLARGRPLDALDEAAASRLTLYRDLLAGLEALPGTGGTATGEALWLTALAGERTHAEVLPVLTMLCEDLLRLAAGGSDTTLAAPGQAERLRPLAERLTPETAGGMVSACYASARQGLATGLKSEELQDALSLALSAVGGAARPAR
jgi:DNA polymerase-3 subunit delta'